MVDGAESQSHEPGALLPGTSYLVGRRLGRGGMGTVYDTTHLATGERYAVKVLSTRFTGREDLEARMLREAAVLGSLDAPNIVRVYDVGYLATDVPFYAMERLEGQTLRDVLRRCGPLAPGFACSLAYQMLEALAVVHDAGVVHRDVKPENLFLRTDGTCVLLDFGLVKVLLDGGRFGPQGFVTAPGQVVGTHRYLPPEIFDDASKSDGRTYVADIYAVGVVLVELLTGRLPLDGAPNDVYMIYLERHGFPRPYDQPPGPLVPDALRPLVERATARNPSDRFPSARAFADELAYVCQRAGFDLHGKQPWPCPPTPPAPLRFVSRPLAASFVSGVAVTLAVSALVTWRPDVTADVRLSPEPHVEARGAAAPTPTTLTTLTTPPTSPTSPTPTPTPTPTPIPTPIPTPTPTPTPSLPEMPPPALVGASARPPNAPASTAAKGAERRAQLARKLRSGQGTIADAHNLAGLCHAVGDHACLNLAVRFIQSYGGAR
ncbi:MAG: serine/threonine protein kinase [Polyangiaceae bacterium]|nr:serine/threonine protein kinase [Polyangiaceae bacterium]